MSSYAPVKNSDNENSNILYALGETEGMEAEFNSNAKAMPNGDEIAETEEHMLLWRAKRNRRIRCYRFIKAWILICGILVICTFGLGIFLFRQRMNVLAPDSTDGALVATDDFHLALDVSTPSLDLRIRKNITIESDLPFTLKGIVAMVLYSYERSTPKIIFETVADEYSLGLKPGEDVVLHLEHDISLSPTNVYDVTDLRGAILAMNVECEEKKSATITMLISFCHRFAFFLCNRLAGTTMNFEVPCLAVKK